MSSFQKQRRKLLALFGLGVTASVGATLGTQAQDPSSALKSSFNLSLRPKRNDVNLNQPLHPFQGISQWLNSTPLTVADLQGKVVLVQFWAFGCINSQRTLPYVTSWYQKYAQQGLEVIGIHTPEFDYERDENNVKEALGQYQITYPVALDNSYKTWRAYQNRYWPHLFLASRDGIIQYHHIGEGAYQETEKMIQRLLA